MGLKEPGLNRLIHSAYRLLDLITYFTAGVQEGVEKNPTFGSFAFEQGPQDQLMKTADGDSVYVDSMTMGISNGYSFVGYGGPYWTDTNGVITGIVPATDLIGSINVTNISNAVSLLVQGTNNAYFSNLIAQLYSTPTSNGNVSITPNFASSCARRRCGSTLLNLKATRSRGRLKAFHASIRAWI